MSKPAAIISDISLNNQDGMQVRLSDFRGTNVVLFSFPDNSAAMTRQMTLIQRLMERFESTHTIVFGVSPVRASVLNRLKNQHRLSYDLLSDPQGQLQRVGNMAGYVVLDERGTVLDSGSNLEPESCVENALRAVKIHTAILYARA